MTNKHLMRLLLLIVAIVIASCAFEEEIIKQHAHENEVKVVQKSLDELLKNPQFVNAAKRIPRKKGFASSDEMSRSALEDQLRFTIIDVPIKIVTMENRTYYIMKIETDDRTDTKLENFVLYEEPADGKIGDIITYNTERNAIATVEQINGAGIKDIRDVTEAEIKEPELGKFQIVSFVYPYCHYEGTPNYCGGYGEGCGFITETQTVWVPDIGGGLGVPDGPSNTGNPSNSGQNGGSSGGGTGSGTGSDPDTPVISAPVIGGNNNGPSTPCVELAKISTPMTYSATNPHLFAGARLTPNAALADMSNYLTELNEVGYALRNFDDFQQYGPTAFKVQGAGTHHVRFVRRHDMYGTIHTHPIDQFTGDKIRMFSHDDVFQLLQMAQDYQTSVPHSDNIFVSVILTKHGNTTYTYAIKIKDKALLEELGDLKNIPDEWNNLATDLRTDYEPNVNQSSSPEYLQKIFLRNFKPYGVSLYKLENNQWKELELSADELQVNPKPC